MEVSMEKLLQILSGIRPDIDFEQCDDLIMSGLISSFDILQIVAVLSDEYDVDIPPREIRAANFKNLSSINRMLIKVMLE